MDNRFTLLQRRTALKLACESCAVCSRGQSRKLLAASLLLGPGTAFLSRRVAGLDEQSGYGPLAPATDLETGFRLLRLPAGFQYRSFGWTASRLRTAAPHPICTTAWASFRRSTGVGIHWC